MVLNTTWPYYAFEELEAVHENNRMEKVKNAETSRFWPSKQIAYSRNKKNRSLERILFRIINDLQPKTMLEVGCCSGIDTLYMAKACPKAKLISTIEQTDNLPSIEKALMNCPESDIRLFNGPAGTSLEGALAQIDKLDFVLFNATKDRQRRLNDFTSCLRKAHAGSVFVLKNIHQTPEQGKTWDMIRNHPNVRVSIDLLHMGILLFKPELVHKNLRIRINRHHHERLH
jgi:predicted O-methyltransferase YrrM